MKFRLGESGSWYLLEKNRGVEKITAALLLWFSAAHVIEEDFFLIPAKSLQCLIGHRSKRYSVSVLQHYSGKTN